MDVTFYEYLQQSKSMSDKSARLYFRAVQIALKREIPESLLESSSLGASRKDTYRKALLHYSDFTSNVELRERIGLIHIPGRWKRKRAVEALSTKEWFALQEEIERGEDKLFSSALMLLCNSGLRIAELLDLPYPVLALALEEGKAKTKQKGDTYRWYVIASESQWSCSSALFDAMTTARNTVWKILTSKRRKKRSSVESAIAKELLAASKRAGIKKHVHPHMLRRTAGDQVRIAAHGDMKVVQDFLGHKSLRTTLAWYQDHSPPEEVQEALGKALAKGSKD